MTIDGKLGTRVFMAPEFSAGSDAIPTDIWSMGVTLYVMAYGELPFPISNKKPHYDKFRNQEGDDTDTHLWSLIKRLLEHNPTARISMDRLRVTNMNKKKGNESTSSGLTVVIFMCLHLIPLIRRIAG